MICLFYLVYCAMCVWLFAVKTIVDMIFGKVRVLWEFIIFGNHIPNPTKRGNGECYVGITFFITTNQTQGWVSFPHILILK